MSLRVALSCVIGSQFDGARPLSAHTRSREMPSDSDLFGACESHMFVLLRDATQFRAISDGSSHHALPAESHVSVASYSYLANSENTFEFRQHFRRGVHWIWI